MSNRKVRLIPLIFDVFHPPRYVILLAVPLARSYLHLSRLTLEQIEAWTGKLLIFVLLVHLKILSSLDVSFCHFKRLSPVPRVYLLDLIPSHLAQGRVDLAEGPRHHGTFEGGSFFWILHNDDVGRLVC
jgi:hypothetical protein